MNRRKFMQVLGAAPLLAAVPQIQAKYTTYDSIGGRDSMEDMFHTPVMFTKYEGGPWLTWNNGKLSPSWTYQRSPVSVYMGKDVAVHSLMFHSDLSDFYVRWDCINGWNQKGIPAQELYEGGV